MSLHVSVSQAARSAGAVLLTAVVAACGTSNPIAPASAVVAEPVARSISYSAGGALSAPQSIGSTAPFFLAGGAGTNYTCSELATMKGGSGAQWLPISKDDLKLDNAPVAGSYTLTDGVVEVKIANGTLSSFDWSSDVAIDAVFVKSGVNGHNLYVYPGEATSGTGLSTPFVDNKYQDISHISFCYDVELVVSKTATTSFTRDYDWSITKAVDNAAVTVPDAGSATVNYSVAVAKDAGTDSDWAVAGAITVTNPHPAITASGITVSDQMTDFGAVAVACPATVLAPLARMTCTYATTVASGAARTNSATADSSTYGITQGQASAPVAFVTPTTVVDNAVTVTDTFAGAGLPATAIAASQTFTYARAFSAPDFAACGAATTFGNTASIATDDGAARSASASVTATLTCPPPPPPPASSGCTLTQGYWGTHSSKGPAKYDATWGLIGENTPFYLSGATYYGVLQLPTKGNAYFVLAHQFIAAKLNILKGATAPAGFNMGAVEAFFQANTPGQIAALKGSAPARAQALAWASTLDAYNNGLLNVAHCGS